MNLTNHVKLNKNLHGSVLFGPEWVFRIGTLYSSTIIYANKLCFFSKLLNTALTK